jgi:tRNA A37 threonylcarbamoyltransferase TsaD
LTCWAEDNEIELSLVPLGYSGDNAAMIGWAALLRYRAGGGDDLFDTVAQSRIPLGRESSLPESA